MTDPRLPDATLAPVAASPATDDLGLGQVVAQESRERFLNKDGSFNVARGGLGFWRSLSLYYDLVSISWSVFFVLLLAAYLLVNASFALLYLAAGPGALSEMPSGLLARFWACFFFSVQTFGTIGFGHVYPNSFLADLLVTAEAFVGLLGVALATGVLFARFSKPRSRILFSQQAVIAPFGGGWALMFRVVNAQRTQIIEVEAEVTYAWFEGRDDPATGERRLRRFRALPLERQRVSFFPLAWTLVHPIDAGSPLWGRTHQDLLESEAEVLAILRGLDDAVYGAVRARSSYRADEIVWHARFSDMYRRDRPGRVSIDVGRLDQIVAIDGEGR